MHHSSVLSSCFTHHRLVAGEHLAQTKHQQHEAHEPQQLVPHLPPLHGARRRVNPVPDVHVEVPVDLNKHQKTPPSQV